MTPTDAFTNQIVQLVRRMPDDAILALVKNQLSGVKVPSQSLATVAKARPGRPAGSKNAPKAAASTPAAAPKAAAPKGKPGRKKPGPKPKAAKKAAKKAAAPKRAAKKAGRKPGRPAGRPGRPAGKGGSGKGETLSLVERVVKAGNGLAASDVAKAAGIPQSRASSALKELKLAKRIYQGGDRRFARYAGDAKSAESASLAARKNAAGPQGKKRK